MSKKFKIINFFFYFLLIFIFDYILTYSFFKKTSYWTSINDKFSINKKWRIESDLYHHDIVINIDVINNWGHLNYKLITN